MKGFSMPVETLARLGASALLYAFTKALNRAVGSSAAAVMRQAGPDMVKQLDALGVTGLDSPELDILQESLGKLTKQMGFCKDISIENEGFSLKLHVKDCAFWDLTQNLKEEGIPPFACPFAGMAVALVERNLGIRARIKELTCEKDRESLIHVELVMT